MSDTNTNGADQALQDYLTRIEALEAQIELAQDQIADIYKDVKLDGFDVKAVKKMVKSRKIELVKDIDSGELYESATGGQ
jgi:uncharacterized protein (UPF0335 family)